MPNPLASEKSPYLRQHADNPVDWLPWGEEAFAKARAEQKPIFLSIGYSTCHWCHVMAHESFEDAKVAAVLNRDFVPVKVDREERPDVDRVYMAYIQATTGHGGWPMSVWLTPTLKPFYGGTYFPPENNPQGRTSFSEVLRLIATHWSQQREKILSGADEVTASLQRYATEGRPREVQEGEPAPLHEAAGDAFEKSFQYFYEAFDAVNGGFGGAPKFPRPSTLNLLFRVATLQGVQSEIGAEAVKLATFTLQKMAGGGMHDHIGGGFHRYAVDAEWFVPHFEKMLYDQAQLAVSYLEAKQATGREVFAWFARDIFDYVTRDLTSPQGGFYSAEDADSLLEYGKPEHAEGAFYVWTKTEIVAALGEDAEFFCAHYGVKEGGNVENDPQNEFVGKNILMQRQPLVNTAAQFRLDVSAASDKLIAAHALLHAVRAKRPHPHLDDKIITAWNGLMISAFAKGAQVLERADGPDVGPYLTAATRAAEFIQRELFEPSTQTLYRSWREGRSEIQAFAEDYAALIQGLLDLYEASFEIRWLQWAEQLQAKMDELFWDEAGGGYFNSRADDGSIIVRLKEDYDGAEPSPNSLAAMNLVRLERMLGAGAGALSRDTRAVRTVEALRQQWANVPQALPQMLCAVEFALEPPRSVVLAGDPESDDFRALAAVLNEALAPKRVILAADGGEAQRWLAERLPHIGAMKPINGRAAAYVCEGFTCQAPTIDVTELRAQLQRGAS
ncbi:thioredoxin domain-containing protein [Oleiharenicola lentus]|uniref:thioredoxin domain-containing protein n=1 Tax=Oleiharenicola lentus TaxID=2508720 RepID=UPI003F66377F